jgi:hypothetical protein
MKKKYNYLPHLVSFVMVYLSFAFVQANLNPFEWSQEVRQAMIGFNLFWQCLIALLQFLYISDK